ncbi:MAG: hypothetical protein ACJ8AT_18345 [Hyalangium sp.]|uniref:hypothetical protein n=1 Tax=Hyalangium sp. TaxID=2028555 RepID=UPI00389A4C9E
MRCRLALAVGALLVLGTGCSTTNAERRVLLARVSSEVAYNLPPQQVMDAARAVLDERGYEPDPGSSPNAVNTRVKVDGDYDTLTRWSKVLVIGQQRSDGRFVVRTQQVTWVTPGRAASHPGMASSVGNPGKHGSDGTTNYVAGEAISPAKPVFSRAFDIEWDILQHLEPRFAAQVEKQVDIYLASNHH